GRIPTTEAPYFRRMWTKKLKPTTPETPVIKTGSVNCKFKAGLVIKFVVLPINP
ncbi:MAG: hypothetical protein RLZ61_2038, partial [Planctomycetota bacterium]